MYDTLLIAVVYKHNILNILDMGGAAVASFLCDLFTLSTEPT